ncbi:MAG TPA: stage II sporulation protein M [Chitinophagaceae bacterium]|nr:stage II sporulation protein M [Chitinophagaceae bacterium]
MREALFIKKNKERWENITSQPSANPDEMAMEFTQLVDDLGYAKTFYPHSKVTRFLNTEASRRYLSIYRNRKEERNKLVRFFKYDVPLAIVKHHVILLCCLGVFLLFFFVGLFSSIKDEHFVREMMGDPYVNMTEDNIASGNPFGVYQSQSSLLMWIQIMTNNISVSFFYFLEGIVPFVLAIRSLVLEAIRLGAFEYMFYAKGYGGMAVLTVLIHGTLELSAIIIAVAAGIILGKSWIFPGTVKRIDAFKQGAKDGAKIMVSLMPVFVIAAFFESFVTRHYRDMPAWVNFLILTLSLLFIVGYFVIYPIKLSRQIKKQMLLQHGK